MGSKVTGAGTNRERVRTVRSKTELAGEIYRSPKRLGFLSALALIQRIYHGSHASTVFIKRLSWLRNELLSVVTRRPPFSSFGQAIGEVRWMGLVKQYDGQGAGI